MKSKLCILIFVILILNFNDSLAEENNGPTQKITADSLQFWEKSLKYGTTSQKKSILYSIKGKQIKEAVPIIIKYLPDENNISIKKEMLSILVELSNEAAKPYLKKFLEQQDIPAEMEEFILSAIGMVKYKEGGKYILKYLDSDNIQLKQAALRSLGEIQYEDGLQEIINKFKNEKDDRIRTEMILAVVNIKSKKAEDFLISIFTNKKEKSINRGFSATGLGYIKTENSYKILTQELDNSKADIKVRIIDALGNLGDKRAANKLIECLKDDDKDIRYFAAESLGKLKDQSAIDILEYKKEYDPEYKVRKAAEEALKKIKGCKVVSN